MQKKEKEKKRLNEFKEEISLQKYYIL